MMTITGAATPVNPSTTSAPSSVSSSETISSFAEQLASAIVQMGADVQPGSQVQIDIAAAPSQDSDTRQFNVAIHSTPGAVASPSTSSPGVTAPKQYSFFQYIIDGASAPVASAGTNQASAPAAPSAQANSGWLSAPYYVAPPPIFVSWESSPGVVNRMADPESDLQQAASQLINDPEQFVWGGIEATTPQELTDSLVNYAQLRAASYPKTCPDGYDPVEMGKKYADVVMDNLKQIKFSVPGSPHASIYDAWVAGVNIWPGKTGTANA